SSPAPAIIAAALHRRGRQEIVSRNVREALEVGAIGEFCAAGRPALVAGLARIRPEIDAASGIAQFGIAIAPVGAADNPLQSGHWTFKIGGESFALASHPRQPCGPHPHLQLGSPPVHATQDDPRPVQSPLLDVSLCQAFIIQNARARRRPRRQPPLASRRPGRPAARRPAADAVRLNIPVMVGGAGHDPVCPLEDPGVAQRRRAALDPLREFVGDDTHQTLTSIRGAAAIRPEAKLSSVTSRRSASNRTGTSNSKPAVTIASTAGGAWSVTTPVAGSTSKAPPCSSSDPTATRTESSTGL